MSYAEAGTARPLRSRIASRFASAKSRPDPDIVHDDAHEPEDDASSIDWQHIGLVAVGVAVGALVGVSAALLYAPERGAYTRRRIGRGVRASRLRLADAWQDLGDELRVATRRGRRRVRRAARGAADSADLARMRF